MSGIEKQYRVCDAADLLSLKESTLRKWILLRKIGVRKIGGAVRIPESEIARLLRSGYIPPTEARP
jgi:excisionase family DNA binding protein